MPSVRMLSTVSGSRDGVAWPAPGETIDVPDDEAEGLIASGVAEPADTKHDETPSADDTTSSAGIQGDALRTGRK